MPDNPDRGEKSPSTSPQARPHGVGTALPSGTPLVSVIIPTYNHAGFVLRSIESALSQSLKAAEVIVVNDGATDGTDEVLRPHVELGRIRYFSQTNQGQSAARNRGLAEARGRYIAFLDDDDCWPTDKLEWQVRFLEAHPDAGIVGGTLQVIDENEVPGKMGPHHANIDFELLFNENPFLSPGQVLIRTALLRELGGMDRSIWGADDWDLWFKAARRARIVMLDRLALFYRVHAANSSRHTARLFQGCCQTIQFHARALPADRRRRLRRTAMRTVFRGLGVPLVSLSRREFFRGKPVAAVRALHSLAPLGADILDVEILKLAVREFLVTPIRRRLGGSGQRPAGDAPKHANGGVVCS